MYDKKKNESYLKKTFPYKNKFLLKKNFYVKKIPKKYAFKVFYNDTINMLRPNWKLKKNLKVSFFAFLKYNINIVKYFLPNLIEKKNMFFYKFFSNPIQKFKIINKGKKYLKKRYQFRRIFRKKFYMSKYF